MKSQNVAAKTSRDGKDAGPDCRANKILKTWTKTTRTRPQGQDSKDKTTRKKQQGHTVVKVGRYSEIYLGVYCRWPKYSNIEGNIPKLIVHYIFRNIPRFYCDIKNKKLFKKFRSVALLCGMRTFLTNRPTMLLKYECEEEQVWISKQFSRGISESFVIYHGM